MWYYFYNQKSVGPVSSEELIRLIQTGVITNTTFVWQPRQARRQAGQIPEFALYFQGGSRPRPQPTPRQATMSSPPMQEQRYFSEGQQSTTYRPAESIVSKILSIFQKGHVGSAGGNKTSLFQKICFIAVIACSALSLFGTFIYWGCYERDLDGLAKYGYIGYSDVSSTAAFSAICFLIAALVCVPVVLKGIAQKSYQKAIVCVAMVLAAIGYHYYTNFSESSKRHEIEQQLSTKPYYTEVATLRWHLISIQDRVRNIAEHQPCDPDSEEVEQWARQAVAQLRDMHLFNIETLEMLINGADPNEIRNRYVFVNQNYLQINRQLDSVYQSYRRR